MISSLRLGHVLWTTYLLNRRLQELEKDMNDNASGRFVQDEEDVKARATPRLLLFTSDFISRPVTMNALLNALSYATRREGDMKFFLGHLSL